MESFLHLYSTADFREMNNVVQRSMKPEAQQYFYANVQHERNIIAPWPLCRLKINEPALQPNRNGTSDNPIVICDSDDDEVPNCKFHCKDNLIEQDGGLNQ